MLLISAASSGVLLVDAVTLKMEMQRDFSNRARVRNAAYKEDQADDQQYKHSPYGFFQLTAFFAFSQYSSISARVISSNLFPSSKISFSVSLKRRSNLSVA